MLSSLLLQIRLLPAILLIHSTVSAQQPGDYRSTGNVDLNMPANWERFNGTGWITAATAPNGQLIAGNIVTIQPVHEWSNTSGAVIPVNVQLVHSGSTGSFTTAAGNKLTINGTYIHHTASSIATILTGMLLAPGSQFIYRGSNTLVPAVSFSNRTYHHLRIESLAGTLSLNLAGFAGGTNPLTVNGTFEVGPMVTLNRNTFTGILQFNGDINLYGTLNIPGFTIAAGKTLTLGNAAILQIPAGESVTAEGVLDAGTGIIEGAGNLVVNGSFKSTHAAGVTTNGNLRHTGTTIFGTSAQVCFNGDSMQEISGRTYPHLVVSGPGVKKLTGNSIVTGNLALAGGKLLLDSFNLEVNGAASTDGNSYVQTNGSGSLQLNAVTGSRNFPVGNSRYNPLLVTHGEGLNWKVRVIDSIVQAPTPFAQARAVLRTWDILPSAAPAIGAEIRFQYNDADPAQKGSSFQTAEAVVAWNYHSGAWNNASLGLTPDGNAGGGIKQVTLTGQLQFSPFVLANISGPLPLRWLYVQASRDKNEVQLRFATAGESILDYCVEASAATGSFQPWHHVKVQGEKLEQHVTVKQKADPSFSRFRVRATGLNGKLYYSGIIHTKDRLLQRQYIPEESLLTGTVRLNLFNWPKGRYTVNLLFSNGAGVRQGTVFVTGDKHSFFIYHGLNPGYYILQWNGPANGTIPFVMR